MAYKPVATQEHLTGVRICGPCGRELPLNSDNFWRDRFGRAGFYVICKQCATEKKRRGALRVQEGDAS